MDGPAAPYLDVTQSLSGKLWRSRLTDDRLALAIAQKLDLPEVIGRVLAARDVGLDDSERYLDPTLKELMPNPSVLTDMDKACDRRRPSRRDDCRVRRLRRRRRHLDRRAPTFH
jgi:single-stranded-DNA-specific exonuclease